MKHLASIAFWFAVSACGQERPQRAIAEARPPAECIVNVAVKDTTIEYEGGGLTGAVPRIAPDLSALKPLVGRCSARITASDATLYRDVIPVMEAVQRIGLVGSIGDGRRAKPTRPPSVQPSPGGPPDQPSEPSGELVATISIRVDKSDVAIQGVSIGTSPYSAQLAAAIQRELSKDTRPTDPNVILAIDQSLPFSAVRQAVQGVEACGYTKLAFAVE